MVIALIEIDGKHRSFHSMGRIFPAARRFPEPPKDRRGGAQTEILAEAKWKSPSLTLITVEIGFN